MALSRYSSSLLYYFDQDHNKIKHGTSIENRQSLNFFFFCNIEAMVHTVLFISLDILKIVSWIRNSSAQVWTQIIET